MQVEQQASRTDEERSSGDGVVFQSRLQAKRQERLHQRMQQQRHQASLQAEVPAATARDSSEVDARVRLRGEARRAIVSYGGTVWDALRDRNLELVQQFFVVEGAQRLLNKRSPEFSDAGRSLLHCAAWLGDASIARFLLDAGAAVDAIDSAASRTTPLMEAARAGHRDVCALLLQRGADAMHRDAHGDTAFHWAARRKHGSLLVDMALAVDTLEGRGASDAVWKSKNLKGKSVLDYVRASPIVLSLLQKRVRSKLLTSADAAASVTEKRKSRFPVKSSGDTAGRVRSPRASYVSSAAARLYLSNPSTPEHESIDEEDDSEVDRSSRISTGSSSRVLDSRGSTPLVGVDALGLDVAPFAYKARDELASR